MNDLLGWKTFIISLVLWITGWNLWDYGMKYFTFTRKHSHLINLSIFVFLTLYVFSNNNIHWSEL